MEEKEKITKEFPIEHFLEISLKENFFLWLQGKTGTFLAKKIFKNFGFYSYRITDGIVNFSEKLDVHAHSPHLFSTHEQFQFIATIRNPYQTLFSEFVHKTATKESFKGFLEKKFVGSSFENKFFTRWERLPDYVIRLENVLEDYLKIPFILESELYKSGKLKKIIESKPNKSPYNHNWKDFYDKQIADLVYYNTSQYFDMFEYDKNSWKS